MRPYFYPRSPCGERLFSDLVIASDIIISIHALLAESDFDDLQVPASVSKISIHALLAESDVNTADQEARKRLISIHALLAESDA